MPLNSLIDNADRHSEQFTAELVAAFVFVTHFISPLCVCVNGFRHLLEHSTRAFLRF